MIENYLSVPIVPQAPQRERECKFKAKRFFTAGEVMTALHTHLPYRVPLTDYGMEYDSIWRADDPEAVAYYAKKEALAAFLANTGPIMFPERADSWERYGFDPNGTWVLALSWVYLKDPKMISVLKLAFG